MSISGYQSIVRIEVKNMLKNLGPVESYRLTLSDNKGVFTTDSGEDITLSTHRLNDAKDVCGYNKFWYGEDNPLYILSHNHTNIVTLPALIKYLKTIGEFLDTESLRVKTIHSLKQKSIFALKLNLNSIVRIDSFQHLEQIYTMCLDPDNGIHRRYTIGMIDKQYYFLIQRSKFNIKP